MTPKNQDLKKFLDEKVEEYNRPEFIKNDPVCIPHLFSKKQDIEIAALFAAVFAWGNRTTIINKSKELMQLMDNAPYDFCLLHDDSDLKKLMQFKHRTFNTSDLLYFIEFLKFHYSEHDSLETAFAKNMNENDGTIENALTGFHNYFFSLDDVPERTKNILPHPIKNLPAND